MLVNFEKGTLSNSTEMYVHMMYKRYTKPFKTTNSAVEVVNLPIAVFKFYIIRFVSPFLKSNTGVVVIFFHRIFDFFPVFLVSSCENIKI